MKNIIIFLIILLSQSAHAELYFDVGIMGGSTGYRVSYYTCLRPSDRGGCYKYGYKQVEAPFGLLEAGYTKNNLTIFILHISSIPDHDRGLDLFGIKYRFK